MHGGSYGRKPVLQYHSPSLSKRQCNFPPHGRNTLFLVECMKQRLLCGNSLLHGSSRSMLGSTHLAEMAFLVHVFTMFMVGLAVEWVTVAYLTVLGVSSQLAMHMSTQFYRGRALCLHADGVDGQEAGLFARFRRSVVVF